MIGPEHETWDGQIRVAMFAPDRERCGVSDYSRSLIQYLRQTPGIKEVAAVRAPESTPRSTVAAVRSFVSDERLYSGLGSLMRDNAEPFIGSVAHIQHQYFLFGGVAPYKYHFGAFRDSVQAPIVMTVHEIATIGERASVAARAVLRYVNATTFRHFMIRRLFVHTLGDREELRRMGVEESKIVHLPMPAMDPIALPDRDEAKRALDLRGRTVLTVFGFISAKKGYHAALKALQRLPDDCMLLLAGDRHPDDRTDYVASVEREIARMGLAGKIRITGFIPEDRLPYVLAATDIALAPFERTSGSASIAQLLAAGRAIVASDIAPLREIEADSPGCLRLYEAGSTEKLVEAVQSLIQDAAGRAALEAAALAYSEKHSWRRFAEATAQVYGDVSAEIIRR